jgi:sec-independent protein translocase protein TatB
MLNVGPGELLAISMVALIVLGPQRLPGAVRQVGRFVGELRKMSTGFQDELRSAFDDAEVEQARRRTPGGNRSPIDTTATDSIVDDVDPAEDGTPADVGVVEHEVETSGTSDGVDPTEPRPQDERPNPTGDHTGPDAS